MRFHLVTLFPEFFSGVLSCALLGKALESGLVQAGFVNPRDFATDRHKTVDDRPFGGGPGMVMKPGPLAAALSSIPRPGRMLALTPSGRPLTQDLARELALEQDLTILCGRYEGFDERLYGLFPLEPVSVGDFVLSGGEAAACCLIEAVGRLVPGFMGKMDSADEESFSAGLLEYPHFTRPEVFEGRGVPEVLLSGDHAKVARFRRDESLRRTAKRRPDLLAGAELTAADAAVVARVLPASAARRTYLALVHAPVLDKYGKASRTSLTNLDLHDIARCSRTYGLGGMFAVTDIEDQRQLAARLLGHWTRGAGARGNPDRAEALGLVSVCDGIEAAKAQVERETGEKPLVVATSARIEKRRRTAPVWSYAAARQALETRPGLVLFGTGHGLTPETMASVDAALPPIRGLADYNHLSVRAAAAITMDRLFGDIG